MDQSDPTLSIIEPGLSAVQLAQLEPASLERFVDAQVRAFDALTALALTIEQGVRQQIAVRSAVTTAAGLSATVPAAEPKIEVDPQVEE